MASDRHALGRLQTALVQSLIADGDPPPGFDADRVRAAATALRRKRAGELAKSWPALAHELAAQGELPPASLGPHANGRALGLALARARLARGALGDAAFRELCAFELRFRVRHGTPTPRRGPALKLWRSVASAEGKGRWVLALKAPWGAERWCFWGAWLR